MILALRLRVLSFDSVWNFQDEPQLDPSRDAVPVLTEIVCFHSLLPTFDFDTIQLSGAFESTEETVDLPYTFPTDPADTYSE